MNIEATKKHIQNAKQSLKDIKDKKVKDVEAELDEASKSLEPQRISKPDPLAFLILLLFLIGYALM